MSIVIMGARNHNRVNITGQLRSRPAVGEPGSITPNGVKVKLFGVIRRLLYFIKVEEFRGFS